MEQLHPRIEETLEHLCCNCGSGFRHIQRNGFDYWQCPNHKESGDGHIHFFTLHFIQAINKSRKRKTVESRLKRVCELMRWQVKKINTLYGDFVFEIIKETY